MKGIRIHLALIAVGSVLAAAPRSAFPTVCQDKVPVDGGFVFKDGECLTLLKGILSGISFGLLVKNCVFDSGQKPDGSQCVAGSSFKGGINTTESKPYLVKHNTCQGGDCVPTQDTMEWAEVKKCIPGTEKCLKINASVGQDSECTPGPRTGGSSGPAI